MLPGIASAPLFAPIPTPVLQKCLITQSAAAVAFSGRQHALEGGGPSDVGVSAETLESERTPHSLRLLDSVPLLEISLGDDSRCSPSLRGSVRMPTSKLASKTWSTTTRVGLPNGFAVASLHLGNTFSRSAAHSVQAVLTLAAWAQ